MKPLFLASPLLQNWASPITSLSWLYPKMKCVTYMCFANLFVLISLQAFQLVDKPSFRRLLQYLQPSLSEHDIPHHMKIHNEILDHFKLGLSRVLETIEVRRSALPCKFCWSNHLQRQSTARCLWHLTHGHPSMAILFWELLCTILLAHLTILSIGSSRPNSWHLCQMLEIIVARTLLRFCSRPLMPLVFTPRYIFIVINSIFLVDLWDNSWAGSQRIMPPTTT